MFYALLSALFAALTAIFAKLGVANVNSNLATGIKTIVILLIILLMIWCIVFARGEANGIGTLSKQNVVFLTISGVATGLSWLFYFKALQLGKVSRVAPVDKLSVAIVIILSVVFLKEALTLKTAIGAGLIIAGPVLLAIK